MRNTRICPTELVFTQWEQGSCSRFVLHLTRRQLGRSRIIANVRLSYRLWQCILGSRQWGRWSVEYARWRKKKMHYALWGWMLTNTSDVVTCLQKELNTDLPKDVDVHALIFIFISWGASTAGEVLKEGLEKVACFYKIFPWGLRKGCSTPDTVHRDSGVSGLRNRRFPESPSVVYRAVTYRNGPISPDQRVQQAVFVVIACSIHLMRAEWHRKLRITWTGNQTEGPI